MKRIARRSAGLMVLIAFFLLCTCIFMFKYFRDAGTWASHPANRALQQTNGQSGGKIISSDGVVLFSKTEYHKNADIRRALLHTVGDGGNKIVTDTRTRYRSVLSGYDVFDGLFGSSEKAGGTVVLTLDSSTCLAAYNALGKYNGTVGVYNYNTGEMLCMVSKPSFDPANVPDLTKPQYDGTLVNGLVNGKFTPGSVFKIVTAAAAIENIPNISTRTFTCDGGTTIDGKRVNCAAKHGNINFKDAFAKSCNAAFAIISEELGAKTLAKYADNMGVTKSFSVSGIDSSRGSVNLKNAAPIDVAWAGIGQHEDRVNPLQFMILMGGIAGGGTTRTPYYVDSVTSALGIPTDLRNPFNSSSMVSSSTAAELQVLMRYAVTSNYSEKGFADMELCGKTGTAEMGGGKQPHSWFVGFCADPKTPLAFVVVVENGGSGAGNAIPVARKVLAEAVKTF